MSMKNLTPNGRNAFKLSLVNDELSHLMGEVLTVVDASTVGDQNKAMKDLIRTSITKKQAWFVELAWKEQEAEGEGHVNPKSSGLYVNWEEGLVPFDQEKTYSFRG